MPIAKKNKQDEVLEFDSNWYPFRIGIFSNAKLFLPNQKNGYSIFAIVINGKYFWIEQVTMITVQHRLK